MDNNFGMESTPGSSSIGSFQTHTRTPEEELMFLRQQYDLQRQETIRYQQQLQQQQQQFDQLRNEVNQMRVTPAHPPQPTQAVDSTPRRPRHTMPQPAKYNGENKAGYPAFKGLLKAKLKIDKAAIGEEPERVWYGYSCLENGAAHRIYPWIASQDKNEKVLTEAGFFAELDKAFADPQMAQRALEWMNTRKQGSQSFREYLQKFDQKVLEADAWDMSDAAKIAYIRAALNLEMQEFLISQVEPTAYSEYCDLLRRTSDKIDDFKRRKNSRHPRTVPTVPPTTTPAPGDPMDWEPSRTAAGGPSGRLAAKWVETTEINRRKENKLCLRCGKDGHFIKDCAYGPAKRPSAPKQSVKSAQPKATMALKEEEDLCKYQSSENE